MQLYLNMTLYFTLEFKPITIVFNVQNIKKVGRSDYFNPVLKIWRLTAYNRTVIYGIYSLVYL